MNNIYVGAFYDYYFCFAVSSIRQQTNKISKRRKKLLFFFPPKSRAGSVCLGMSQQD